MTKKDIRGLLDRVHRKQRQRSGYEATLGDGQGNLFAETSDLVWAMVTFPSTISLQRVICRKSAPVYGAMVIVDYNRANELEVMEEAPVTGRAFYGEFGTGNVAPHASMHTRYGPDPLYLNSLQVINPLGTNPVRPAGMSVYVQPLMYENTVFEGGSLNLTSYIPTGTGEQRIVITGLDKGNNTLSVVAGGAQVFSYEDFTYIPFDAVDVAAIDIPANFEPSAAVRLYATQTRINTFDIFWDCRRSIAHKTEYPTIKRTIVGTVIISDDHAMIFPLRVNFADGSRLEVENGGMWMVVGA